MRLNADFSRLRSRHVSLPQTPRPSGADANVRCTSAPRRQTAGHYPQTATAGERDCPGGAEAPAQSSAVAMAGKRGTRLRIGHCSNSDASPECPRFFRFFLYGKPGTRLLDRTLRRFGRQPGVSPIFLANRGTRLRIGHCGASDASPECPRLFLANRGHACASDTAAIRTPARSAPDFF